MEKLLPMMVLGLAFSAVPSVAEARIVQRSLSATVTGFEVACGKSASGDFEVRDENFSRLKSAVPKAGDKLLDYRTNQPIATITDVSVEPGLGGLVFAEGSDDLCANPERYSGLDTSAKVADFHIAVRYYADLPCADVGQLFDIHAYRTNCATARSVAGHFPYSTTCNPFIHRHVYPNCTFKLRRSRWRCHQHQDPKTDNPSFYIQDTTCRSRGKTVTWLNEGRYE